MGEETKIEWTNHTFSPWWGCEEVSPGCAKCYARTFAVVDRYDAFWVFMNASGAIGQPNPNPPPGRVLQLQRGWNNFVYSGPSAAVVDALAPLAGKYTQVMRYENATGAWQSYLPGQPRYLNDFAGLLRMNVYWIFMTDAATFTLQ
mgnify:CR=1 FL=1